MNRISKFISILAQIEKNASEMVKSESENAFYALAVFFESDRLCFIRFVTDEINPYESYCHNSEQFVCLPENPEMSGFESESPGFETGEHSLNLSPSGICFQSFPRSLEGYDNEEFSARQSYAADVNFRISYFPKTSENTVFSGFQITEKLRCPCENSSGIGDILIFSDSDDNTYVISLQPQKPQIPDKFTVGDNGFYPLFSEQPDKPFRQILPLSGIRMAFFSAVRIIFF
ncbi:hypothetical protein [Desulfonema magnum]|uniref:Uncharacterized protein n=1 Tax=Desulfonema magnum TaxID=45655 RepID=A0A975BLI2_9BACT|nr:hypothetical protein [Desulfonema magnum]QTA87606.1 Uncharacterized protein dnm_036390 [Desulfonema magnum]